MKINRNMSAVITNRQLLRNESKLTASMEKLSSGFKINRSGDNPAGLAISNKMRAQIDALDQATSNASDAISVLRIADGALNESSSILQRMRELSVQAANGTNSYDDRKSMQAEITKLSEEVDRIATDTEYNKKTLLDGSSDVRVYSKQATRMDVSEAVQPKTYTMEVKEAAEKATYILPEPTGSEKILINGVLLDYTPDSPGSTGSTFFEELRKAAEQAGCTVEKNTGAGGGYKLQTVEYGSDEQIEITVSKKLAETWGFPKNPADPTDPKYVPVTKKDQQTGVETETMDCILVWSGKDAEIALNKDDNTVNPPVKGDFSQTATALVDGNRVKVTDMGGFSMDFLLNEPKEQADGTVIYDKNVSIEVTDIGAMKIQIGANQYQEMAIRIPEVSAKTLYLDKVDVTVSNGPEKAMVTLDEAIYKLNGVRSRIGAFQNRLEHAESSLAETTEDMTNAYSGILDTDMAEEMTVYTQMNVLEQASISVLAQANDLPQQVLSLLQ